MISSAACLLYTQDPELVRRTRAFLRSRAALRHVDRADRLDPVLQQNSPALLLLDLRSHGSRDLIAQLKAEWPDVLIIALGTPRSEPLRDAEQTSIYAAEDVNLERRPFQALIARALEHLRVLEDNRALRAGASNALVPAGRRELESVSEATGGAMLPLLRT